MRCKGVIGVLLNMTRVVFEIMKDLWSDVKVLCN